MVTWTPYTPPGELMRLVETAQLGHLVIELYQADENKQFFAAVCAVNTPFSPAGAQPAGRVRLWGLDGTRETREKARQEALRYIHALTFVLLEELGEGDVLRALRQAHGQLPSEPDPAPPPPWPGAGPAGVA